MELTFDTIIDTLLQEDLIAGIEETYLLNEEGRIVVYSLQTTEGFQSGLHENKALELKVFPQDEVVQAVAEGRSGQIEDENGQLMVFQRLNTLGWYYVVAGDSGVLLANSEENP
ncbi:MAG: hypothetical protein HN348_06680 [Proteobacteria bacterium]|nr:hypothetical protein [Pseudomonadota bacterium]